MISSLALGTFLNLQVACTADKESKGASQGKLVIWRPWPSQNQGCVFMQDRLINGLVDCAISRIVTFSYDVCHFSHFFALEFMSKAMNADDGVSRGKFRTRQ